MENHLTLETPLTALPRVGTQTAKDFKKLGVLTVRDLLYHFPFRHEDFSHIVPAGALRINEQASVRVRVHTVKNTRSPRKRRLYTEAIFEDNSGSVKAVWFNQPYLPTILHRGDWVLLSGTLEDSYFGVQMTNPVFEKVQLNEDATHAGRLVPVYHTRGNLTSRTIRSLVRTVLVAANSLLEWLPETIRSRNNFSNLEQAIINIHFPKDTAALAKARRRLAFDELFNAQLLALRARRDLDRLTAPIIPFDEAATKAFVGTLPFSLTSDQRRAAWQIIQDLSRARPMHRLLEGEVGSGKTVVAAMAILHTALAGYATTYLAPTEILARQHADTLAKLLKGFPVRLALFTQAYQELAGATVHRGALETAIQKGEVDLVIGTHTLLHEEAHNPRTALVIVDEQHRFGVEQRRALRARGTDTSVPHLLSMTATPIPRTLALTVYGDLDISVLREMPKGRQIVKTTLVGEAQRKKAYAAIHDELAAGRQGFVICPLISESDKLGVRAATKEHETLQRVFPEFSIGLLHGKLKADAKARVMEDFRSGRAHLLVATAVVEVGIDMPNATIMIIEGAERFGLAQLHQFRGRIGRGTQQAHCYLFTDTTEANERLAVFSRIHDGFLLAEKDLALRGPGEFFGTTQSGFPKFRIADLQNLELLELARQEVAMLLKHDPELTNHPLLKERSRAPNTLVHLE